MLEDARKVVTMYETNEAFEELQEWFDNQEYLEAESIEGLIYQLTAYEQFGAIDFNEFLDDQVQLYLGELDDENLVALHNELNEDFDDYIYTDLEEMCEGLDTWQIVNRIHFGDYHGDTIGYFQFNGYGNIVEDYPTNLICMSELTRKYIYNMDIEPSSEVEALIETMALELVKMGY